MTNYKNGVIMDGSSIGSDGPIGKISNFSINEG